MRGCGNFGRLSLFKKKKKETRCQECDGILKHDGMFNYWHCANCKRAFHNLCRLPVVKNGQKYCGDCFDVDSINMPKSPVWNKYG